MPKVKRKNEKTPEKPSTEEKNQVKEQKSTSEQKVQVKEQVKTETKQVGEVKAEVTAVESIVEDRLKELGAVYVSKSVQCTYDKNMTFRFAIMPNKRKKKPAFVITLVRASEKTGYISSVVPIAPNVWSQLEKLYRETVVQYEQRQKEFEKKKKEAEARQLINSLDKETLQILKQLLSQL